MFMCKLCLDFRLKFNALMTHSKNFNGPCFDSISSYYMSSYKCSEGENGYWALKCVEGKCKNCCNIKPPEIPNLKDEVLRYNEFVVKNVSYVNKKTKEIKESKQTVRGTVEKDVKNVHGELLIESKKYLKHRFLIENYRYHWRIILHRNQETIFHIYFSENVSGSPKYKPQDAHFSKKQFSLLCTVAHHPESNTYLYHLSDNRKHNHSYTKAVVESLINRYPKVNVYRFKSNNCEEQYKCLNVFPIFCQLAMKHKKNTCLLLWCKRSWYRFGRCHEWVWAKKNLEEKQ